MVSVQPDDGAEDATDAAYRTGAAAWPSIAFEREAFTAFARAALASDGGGSLEHAVDLFLAGACAAGSSGAIEAFEATFAPDVVRGLAKLGVHGAAAAEIQQRLRHKLFVAGAGERAKIALYTGRGPLRGWLRALVAHEALSEYRKAAQRAHDSDSVLGDKAAVDDPELEQIRARYTAPFRDAFRDALAGLAPRDRNVLRLVYADGLSVEQVAVTYGVHRVSVSRWLGQIRRDLLEGTRARLRDHLRLDESELASVTRLCLSQIDVSLNRLLAP